MHHIHTRHRQYLVRRVDEAALAPAMRPGRQRRGRLAERRHVSGRRRRRHHRRRARAAGQRRGRRQAGQGAAHLADGAGVEAKVRGHGAAERGGLLVAVGRRSRRLAGRAELGTVARRAQREARHAQRRTRRAWGTSGHA